MSDTIILDFRYMCVNAVDLKRMINMGKSENRHTPNKLISVSIFYVIISNISILWIWYTTNGCQNTLRTYGLDCEESSFNCVSYEI